MAFLQGVEPSSDASQEPVPLLVPGRTCCPNQHTLETPDEIQEVQARVDRYFAGLYPRHPELNSQMEVIVIPDEQT